LSPQNRPSGLSTLHTVNAGETINLSWVCLIGRTGTDAYPSFRHPALVVSQRLAPKIVEDDCAAGNHGRNLVSQEAIRLGETEGKVFMRSSRPAIPSAGAIFDQPAWRLLNKVHYRGYALAYCTKRSIVSARH